MTALNEITGIVALAMYVLTVFGLNPQMRAANSDAAALFAKAVILSGAVLSIRLTYYDLWWSFALTLGFYNVNNLPVRVQYFNAFSNAWFALSSYIALSAMRQSIPRHERAKWPWWRAPFYPGGCFIAFWRR